MSQSTVNNVNQVLVPMEQTIAELSELKLNHYIVKFVQETNQVCASIPGSSQDGSGRNFLNQGTSGYREIQNQGDAVGGDNSTSDE